MIMNVRKQLWSKAHLVMPGVGFVLACSGIYLFSQHAEDEDGWRVIPAYGMISFGLLAVFIGGFWNISLKRRIYQRRQHERNIQIYTIESQNSSPPSYEESQVLHVFPDSASEPVVVVDGVDVVMSLAPPLYNQNSSEAPDFTWSQEQPPRYSLVERIQLGEMDAEERREALSSH